MSEPHVRKVRPEEIEEIWRVHVAASNDPMVRYWGNVFRFVRGKQDYGAQSTAAYLASVGEPLLTGWSQRQAMDIATREGLAVVSDIGLRS